MKRLVLSLSSLGCINQGTCPSASLPLMTARGLSSRNPSNEKSCRGKTKFSTSIRSKVCSQEQAPVTDDDPFLFLGNEEDHIIVSVVRSHAPGFLKNQRRTNVMLTRCKHSMVVCSSRAFLFGKASQTLVGKLAGSLKEENWLNGHDVLCDRIRL